MRGDWSMLLQAVYIRQRLPYREPSASRRRKGDTSAVSRTRPSLLDSYVKWLNNQIVARVLTSAGSLRRA
ncbi:hypothetical protein AcW1_007770 [Taiwanofungus camphoratus]|nr:hypothetical protein AcW1_007770 [Antrodia cinnamomea]